MAFPHPESRNDNYRNRAKPNDESVVWQFCKRTINLTDYRDGKDDMNPAMNRAFGGFLHGWFVNLFCLFYALRRQKLSP